MRPGTRILWKWPQVTGTDFQVRCEMLLKTRLSATICEVFSVPLRKRQLKWTESDIRGHVHMTSALGRRGCVNSKLYRVTSHLDSYILLTSVLLVSEPAWAVASCRRARPAGGNPKFNTTQYRNRGDWSPCTSLLNLVNWVGSLNHQQNIICAYGPLSSHKGGCTHDGVRERESRLVTIILEGGGLHVIVERPFQFC